MNTEDFRRLLSATPDEPPLPVDPVAAVHRRARSRQRRLRAGALAVVALLAAGVGGAVSLPGGHNTGGEAQLHAIAPTVSSTLLPTPPSAPATPPATQTSPAIPTRSPTSTAAALADYAAAKQEWIAGSNTDAADLNTYLGRAASDLSDALTAGVADPASYRSAIGALRSLMTLPDTDVTPAQIQTANADTAVLNRFFDTNLYTPPTSMPAAKLPATPSCDSQLGGSGVRPSGIFFGCATSADALTNITWTTWTSTAANGTATHAVNNCKPDCATGTYTRFPVTVQLSEPGYLDGILVFQHIVATPTTSVGQTETATATSPNGSWGFVPQ